MRMKRTNRKILSLLLCMMLIVAMAVCTTGCKENKESQTTDVEQSTQQSAEQSDVKVLGEGKTEFDFVVVDKDGKETKFEIHTDKGTVGEALLELELIAGDESEYGLYVKTVNGITAEYEVDQTYWAFYVNGEYAQSGVDATEVKDGDTYSFKVEK